MISSPSTQRLRLTGHQSLSPVYKGAVGRTEILEKISTILQRDARVTARDLCFRIFRIKINIGKDAAIGIPAADLRFDFAQHELLARRKPALDHQPRVWLLSGLSDDETLNDCTD